MDETICPDCGFIRCSCGAKEAHLIHQVKLLIATQVDYLLDAKGCDAVRLYLQAVIRENTEKD